MYLIHTMTRLHYWRRLWNKIGIPCLFSAALLFMMSSPLSHYHFCFDKFSFYQIWLNMKQWKSKKNIIIQHNLTVLLSYTWHLYATGEVNLTPVQVKRMLVWNVSFNYYSNYILQVNEMGVYSKQLHSKQSKQLHSKQSNQ